MYCRKCGKKLDRNANRCPYCGADVLQVRQQSYSQRYEEEKQKDRETREAMSVGYPKEIDYRDNIYVPYALWTAVAAFLLAVFPWPRAWGIGTALWMRILILVIALMSIYNCVKGNQISNYNASEIRKYNQRHPKNLQVYEKPRLLTLANVLAVLTAMITTFSIFMG